MLKVHLPCPSLYCTEPNISDTHNGSIARISCMSFKELRESYLATGFKEATPFYLAFYLHILWSGLAWKILDRSGSGSELHGEARTWNSSLPGVGAVYCNMIYVPDFQLNMKRNKDWVTQRWRFRLWRFCTSWTLTHCIRLNNILNSSGSCHELFPQLRFIILFL